MRRAPIDFPSRLPEDLKNTQVRVIVIETPTNKIEADVTFTEKNADIFKMFWNGCYPVAGDDPCGRIVVMLRQETALKTTAGKPYCRTSFILFEGGEEKRFDKEDAKLFLEGEGEEYDLPSVSSI